jgi:CubicO group peptidase (beta-lactamase class C family)
MAFRTFAAVILSSAFAAIAGAPAHAAHPSIDACGGAYINKDEGVRNGRVVSRAMERRIEAFLQRADATPGASIAIVKGDRIVYARGFGFRDLEGCAKATSDTRYYLKSTTKSFLGAAAAVLHEEGAIELDAPIAEYLPGLKLPDGISAGQISIRSHLTHTLPYFDAGMNYRTAFPGNLPDEELVAHVNEYSRIKDTKYRYSNFGPIMAAHAIGAKTGLHWREFIAQKVFAPAGMNDSFTVMAEAKKGPMAVGFLGAQNNAYEMTETKVDSQMHAAGGSVSTVADIGRWLIINLNGGMIDGAQAIPQRAIEQVQARQAQLKASYSEYNRFAYGLGLYSADYDGDLLLHHFGGETHMSFMPEHGLGVVVLANELGFGSVVTHRLASTIYDMLLDKPDIDDRIARRLKEIDDRKTSFVDRLDGYLAQMKKQAPEGEPTFTPNELIGDYVDPRLGKMSVSRNDGGLELTFGALSGPLTHISGDGYLADFDPWGGPTQLFVFRTDEQQGFVLDWGGRIFERQE